MGPIKLKSISVLLIGFTRALVLPLEMIDLPLCLGKTPNRATQMTTFMVMNQPSAYNVIMGRPALNAFHVVPFTYQMLMKFPTIKEIRVVKGNQTDTRQCYTVTIKNSGHPE